jgi:chemotaxis protein methyltransferase CheR
MNSATFTEFRELVYEHSGINLTSGKEALVSGRVSKRMRALGLADERTYLRYVVEDQSGEELVQLLDAISTNVTHFFREEDHFVILQQHLQQRMNQGQRKFRLWSAACSTGEEPYTMAMTALEAAHQAHAVDVDMRILATDISTRVLRTALAGEYSADSVAPVPAPLRNRYFDRERTDTGDSYHANAAMKRMIAFRRLNLSQPPFPIQGPLDAIFCRNVMIYFDHRVRTGLIREFERVLRPGGLLLIGHSESLAGVPNILHTVKPSVYRKEHAS